MDKIRIGNDIHIEWLIFRNNQPEVFEGKDVEVRLMHTRTRDVMPLDWVISEGVVSATFYGKDQINTGDYKLMLVENNGAPNMATIDECKAFTLVQCSCQERKEEPSTSLQLHKVQLTSSFALSGGGNINVEGYPNVDELEEVKELSGNENIIITDTESNKKTTVGKLKEYVEKGGGGATSESPYFKTFATEADYLVVKDDLETSCIIYIEDKDNIIYHSVTKANLIYEVNEDYEDFCLTNLGVPANSIANAMLGLAENSVILTMMAPLFSSFIVDGQEMITGNEYFDFGGHYIDAFENACIIMPYQLGKTYEVQAVFKSTDEIIALLSDAGSAEVLQFLFTLTPLTKLTIDDNYIFTMSLTDENTIIGHVFSLMGAYMLKELTYNVESNPYINLPENYVEYLLVGFRMGVIESDDFQPYYKERILNVNNDSSWGEPYVSGEFDESRLNDFLYMMSIPGEVVGNPEMINYTINRI